MRKQWFGDSRDYVKWSVVWRESEPDLTVLYVAMARPDELKGNVHEKVVHFFDSKKDYSQITDLFGVRITVIDQLYESKKHREYFENVIASIEILQTSAPILVFLDPDTGIEPRGTQSNKHVLLSDLEEIAKRLHSGSRLLIYQHATKDKRIDWQTNASQKFMSLPSASSFELRIVDDKACAHDVCFLVATKL